MKAISAFLVITLALAVLIQAAEAKSKSFNIQVSCRVPQRLELNSPIEAIENANEQEMRVTEISPSKIQSQQVRFQGNQKTIIYTTVER